MRRPTCPLGRGRIGGARWWVHLPMAALGGEGHIDVRRRR